MNSTPTAGVLLFKDDMVLLVRHGEGARHLTGAYGVPGGHIDEGETEIIAAIRELEEETGLVATENDLEELPLDISPADIPRKDGTIKRFTITVFLCRNYSGTLRATDEAIPEWIEISKLDTLNLIGNTKIIIVEGKKYE